MSIVDCIVKYVEGHVEAYSKCGVWLQSADSKQELEHDLLEIIEKKVRTVA